MVYALVFFAVAAVAVWWLRKEASSCFMAVVVEGDNYIKWCVSPSPCWGVHNLVITTEEVLGTGQWMPLQGNVSNAGLATYRNSQLWFALCVEVYGTGTLWVKRIRLPYRRLGIFPVFVKLTAPEREAVFFHPGSLYWISLSNAPYPDAIVGYHEDAWSFQWAVPTIQPPSIEEDAAKEKEIENRT